MSVCRVHSVQGQCAAARQITYDKTPEAAYRAQITLLSNNRVHNPDLKYNFLESPVHYQERREQGKKQLT